MITAEECRLGNLLMTIKNDHIVTVGIDEIIYLFEDKTTHKLMGIPLTDEWLEKFGYEVFYCDIEGLNTYLKDDVTIFQQSKGFEFRGHLIEYAHQLQNLHFALTGKELKEEDNFIEL